MDALMTLTLVHYLREGYGPPDDELIAAAWERWRSAMPLERLVDSAVGRWVCGVDPSADEDEDGPMVWGYEIVGAFTEPMPSSLVDVTFSVPAPGA